MSVGAGGARQAHAAWPTPDDQFLLVANQNGKLLERVDTDYANDVFVHDMSATLNLATCVTPNGLTCESPSLRPDNAPICPFAPSGGGRGFISLRGGGMFVIDPAPSPMQIVAEYDKSVINPNGCGFVEARGHVWFNAGGGTPTHLDGFDVYRAPFDGYSPLLPANSPPVQHVYGSSDANRDAHGVVATHDEKYVWMYDRAGNVAEVFDAHNAAHLGSVDLVSPASANPTPDLVAINPQGNTMFLSLRGPNPLSGDPHASAGSTPGLGIVQVTHGGKNGFMRSIIPIHNIDADGVERADAHAIRLRRR